MTRTRPSNIRWHDYVLERGDQLRGLWRDHFSDGEHNILFVLAKSFDPRTCVALTQLLDDGKVKRCDACVLQFDNPEELAVDELIRLSDENLSNIQSLISSVGTVKVTTLKAGIVEGQRITATSATTVFSNTTEIEPYTDLIVDVSGMPRSVFFPLLSKLLYLLDKDANPQGRTPNLFVVVSEDVEIDAAISHEGVDEFADFLPYFHGGFDREAISEKPRVWLPILGENRLPQLQRIEDRIKPSETCPVLPSPARNPRRGDNLVAQYRTFLFDNRRGIDTRNFIYASEDNPFEVYRQLCKAVYDWQDALEPLGGCNVAFSALSSKLMSLGALLAAYDLKTSGIEIAVAHVGCNNYRFEECESATEVFGLWLAGRCYEAG